MCLRPVAFQGCEKASGHGWQSGPGQGRNTSGAVVNSVRDWLDLRRLEKHQNPSYRQGKGRGRGRDGTGQERAEACSDLYRDPHLLS